MKNQNNLNEHTHTRTRDTLSHTDSLVKFFAVLLDFAHSHYTSTYQTNRYQVEWGGGAAAGEPRARSAAQPPADRLPSPHSTSLRVWDSKVSGTCSPHFRCFRLYIEQETPHMVEWAGRHSPAPSTFDTRANGKSKIQQLYLTNTSALFPNNIHIFFFQFLVCLKKSLDVQLYP